MKCSYYTSFSFNFLSNSLRCALINPWMRQSEPILKYRDYFQYCWGDVLLLLGQFSRRTFFKFRFEVVLGFPVACHDSPSGHFATGNFTALAFHSFIGSHFDTIMKSILLQRIVHRLPLMHSSTYSLLGDQWHGAHQWHF